MAKHLVKRGGVWTFRMRCPRRFQSVHRGSFITKTLRTDSLSEAEALVPLVKRQFLQDLEARLAGGASEVARDDFDAIMALAKSTNVRLKSAEELATGSLADLVSRLGRAAALDPGAKTAHFSVLLGGFELPGTTLTELADKMERLLPDEVASKNDRQRRIWRNKWKRAAAAFAECCGEIAIKDTEEQHAFDLRRFWQKKVTEIGVTTDYANKHIGYIAAMIDCFYQDIEIDKFDNPFRNKRIEKKQAWETKQKPTRKLEFSPEWIRDTILGNALANLNPEARDITIVCAETGCRQSEIFDLPASSIRLNDSIPHIKIQVETGADLRDIKTTSSIRDVPLVGAALDAMCRNPSGFPRYRGNSNYYNTTNKFLRESKLMPSDSHSIGGLRHSYETRMRRAGIDNEERGFMMGHSFKTLRGREFYGDETSLQLKALYAEMIAFATPKWNPRSKDEIYNAIEKILTDQGFRI